MKMSINFKMVLRLSKFSLHLKVSKQLFDMDLIWRQ